MQEISFEETLEQVLASDVRYHRDAYCFVREALEYTQEMTRKASGRKKKNPRRAQEETHVTGQELLEGIRQFALNQFGPMAQTVFEEWGVHQCSDFGEIVFNMVEIGLLRRTEKDSRAHFEGGYTFEDAFRKPFLPSSKILSAALESKPTQA